MYGHFIYFIVVLLIYSTYYPPEEPYFGPITTVLLFIALCFIFAEVTRRSFARLLGRAQQEGSRRLHGRFDRIFTRQAMVAIALFAADLYVLNLKGLISGLPPFSYSPTLMAAFFVALFAGYLAVIWACGHQAYTILFRSDVSKKAYVLSNLRFHLPVVLPWLAISLLTDLVDVLPFSLPKSFLARPEGQMVFFACFFAVLVVVAPALIKFFWRCEPLAAGSSRRRIEALCRRARMGYRDILDWPIFEGRMLTAGVMGVVERFRYILVTNGLLQVLDAEELDAVMAHEIGHIKRRHLSFYLLFIFGFVILSYSLFDLITYLVLYVAVEFPGDADLSIGLPALTSFLFTGIMAVSVWVYFRYVFGYFMRNCERQADLYAFHLLGNSTALVSALEKVAVYSGQTRDRPSWHHFSISQRVDYLSRCEADREWIGRHDRKMRCSVVVFVVALALIGYGGYGINYGEIGKTLSTRFFETALVSELEDYPTNPKLHNALASLYYQRGAYEQAVVHYETAISLDPKNVEALNNLAWLYATCEVEAYRRPDKALQYALAAVAVRPDPHVLDTLAESYYANGRFHDAIRAISAALGKKPPDENYYRRQLQKFREAAGGSS
jgi:Zn-dependent protease with chaperone function